MQRIEAVVNQTLTPRIHLVLKSSFVPRKYRHEMLVVSLKWVMTLPVPITTINCLSEYSMYSKSNGSQWRKSQDSQKGLPMVFKENSATWQEPLSTPKGFLHAKYCDITDTNHSHLSTQPRMIFASQTIFGSVSRCPSLCDILSLTFVGNILRQNSGCPLLVRAS